jgi:hypothetical protein
MLQTATTQTIPVTNSIGHTHTHTHTPKGKTYVFGQNWKYSVNIGNINDLYL